MDTLFYGFAVLAFAAVFLLTEGLFLWWSGRSGPGGARMARRLRTLQAGQQAFDTGIAKRRALSASPALSAALERVPRIAVLDRQLLQAGASWTVAFLLGLSLALYCGGLLLALALDLPLPPLLALLPALLPWLAVLRRRAARVARIERQLPDAAEMISRSLRSGHAFSSALQMVGEEMPEPIAAEFRAVFDEVTFGVPMQEALHRLAARVPLPDFRYLVVAILVQREAGGNLTEVLDSIARVMRGRLSLRGEIRVLSAEGRASAWVLGLLPFAVALVMWLLNPDYLRPLWADPLGVRLVQASLLLMAVGVVWMRAVIRIRV